MPASGKIQLIVKPEFQTYYFATITGKLKQVRKINK